jgi:hypothetical protein
MLHIDGEWFKDTNGRIHILRGVNLGGGSKVPVWSRGVGLHDGLDKFESFGGRPFPLDEADEHFQRLKAWGLTFLRFIISWEAIEHRGPGQYDEAYLDYLEAVIGKAGEYGFLLFIDPHQDVWGRHTSGDGAPAWTYAKVGLNVTQFEASGAAEYHPVGATPHVRIWPSNYTKLATAAMFTLFFGGNDFAPNTQIDGEPAQDYLQRHYIAAMKQVAERLKGMPHVLGIGSMNEPSAGYIGWQGLTQTDGKIYLRAGATPTPLQGMALGAGISQKVARWGTGIFGPRQRGMVWQNEEQVRAWLPGVTPIWQAHGVWDVDEQGQPVLLKPTYFSQVNGRSVNFGRDYLRPFINRYAQAIRQINPNWIIFAQNTPLVNMPAWGPDDAPNVVNAAHWYDYFTLFLRFFLPFFTVDIQTAKAVLGPRKVLQSFIDEIGLIRRNSQQEMRGVPTLLGEFGIPFNMPLKLNYKLNWFGNQIAALDASFRALEANLVSGTLWNYTPDNRNSGGDGWNCEDLSLFSRSQQRDPNDLNSGARGWQAFVRPYPIAIAGEPQIITFHRKTGEFKLTFRGDPAVTAPTTLFVPTLQYPNGCRVTVSDGTFSQDLARQRLTYQQTAVAKQHTIRIERIA